MRGFRAVCYRHSEAFTVAYIRAIRTGLRHVVKSDRDGYHPRWIVTEANVPR